MEIYETDKITVCMGYDIENNKAIGKVRKKEDKGNDILVGIVCNGELLINESCTEPEMIKEEYHKLRKQISEYDDFWKARAQHEREVTA